MVCEVISLLYLKNNRYDDYIYKKILCGKNKTNESTKINYDLDFVAFLPFAAVRYYFY